MPDLRHGAIENKGILMKLSTIQNSCKEIFVESDKFSVSVNTWSNYEGASIMVHGPDLSLRMAGAFRWEELDAIIMAIAAARSA